MANNFTAGNIEATRNILVASIAKDRGFNPDQTRRLGERLRVEIVDQPRHEQYRPAGVYVKATTAPRGAGDPPTGGGDDIRIGVSMASQYGIPKVLEGLHGEGVTARDPDRGNGDGEIYAPDRATLVRAMRTLTDRIQAQQRGQTADEQDPMQLGKQADPRGRAAKNATRQQGED